MKIEIYTVPECNICKTAKNYFKSKEIDYEEIDMSIGGIKDTMERKRQFKELGFETYPIIIIKSKSEGELIFPEFDKKSLDMIMENINE